MIATYRDLYVLSHLMYFCTFFSFKYGGAVCPWQCPCPKNRDDTVYVGAAGHFGSAFDI